MGYLLKKRPKIARDLELSINQAVKLELIEEKKLKELKQSIFEALNEIAQIIEKESYAFGKPNFKTLMTAQGPINHLANEFHASATYLFGCRDTELQLAGKILESLANEMYAFKSKLVPVNNPQSEFRSAGEALAYFSDRITKPFKTKFLPLLDLEAKQVDYELRMHLHPSPGSA